MSELRSTRAFRTTMESYEEPDWVPLERAALLACQSPDIPSFHPGEFMWMCRLAARRGLKINLYKHYDTRRYINLDEQGHAYMYCETPIDPRDEAGGFYRQLPSLLHAIRALELERFESGEGWVRSFPPGDWGADVWGEAARSSRNRLKAVPK